MATVVSQDGSMDGICWLWITYESTNMRVSSVRGKNDSPLRRAQVTFINRSTGQAVPFIMEPSSDVTRTLTNNERVVYDAWDQTMGWIDAPDGTPYL